MHQTNVAYKKTYTYIHPYIHKGTLEAEGMVLSAISVMLEKEVGIKSLMGMFAKFTTLLPSLLPIFLL